MALRHDYEVARAQLAVYGEEVQCDRCARINEDGYTCDAFLEQIPWEIFGGPHDHTEPFPGDDGLMFFDSGRHLRGWFP